MKRILNIFTGLFVLVACGNETPEIVLSKPVIKAPPVFEKKRMVKKKSIPETRETFSNENTDNSDDANHVLRINSTIRKFKIYKHRNLMYVFFSDTFKTYRIALGENPVGHKERQGDKKTPEGLYYITHKNPNSRGYKSVKISYPNDADRANARRKGLNPGGDIYIHGLWWPNQDPTTHWKTNWTLGCVAVNNRQMDEIYSYTVSNTPVEILP